jgi:hypothetical protein
MPARSVRRAPSLLLALVLSAGAPVLAQDAKDPALQGPKVTDRNVPGATPDFGMGNARRFGDRIPPEVFRRAMGVLLAEDAPAELRASEELRAKVKTQLEEFEESARRFRREHGKELEELRKAAGEPAQGRRPRAQGEPDAMKDMSPEQQKARDEARLKLRELQGSAPKIEDVYTKMWTELSEPQRNAVQAKLNEWREEQSKRREDEYVRVRARQNAAKPDAAARPESSKDEPAMTPGAKESSDARPPARPRAASDANPRRDRLLRLFNQLTPEEQEQLLQRLEARFAERRGQNTDTGEKGRRPSSKPAPDVDKVKVPNPDSER